MLAAALCSPAALAQTPLTERCERAAGLEKVLTQWHGELVRVRGEKFLLPATARIDTDCVERRVLFPRWWKDLNAMTKQNLLLQPSAQSVADCRRLVGTLEQWYQLLADLPGEPKLTLPAAAVACAQQRGGTNAPGSAAPPAAPAHRPGRIP